MLIRSSVELHDLRVAISMKFRWILDALTNIGAFLDLHNDSVVSINTSAFCNVFVRSEPKLYFLLKFASNT